MLLADANQNANLLNYLPRINWNILTVLVPAQSNFNLVEKVYLLSFFNYRDTVCL